MGARRQRGAGTRRWRWLALAAGLAAGVAGAADPAFLIAATKPVGAAQAATGTDLVLDAQGNAYVSGVIAGYALPGVDSARITNAGFGQRFVARFDRLATTPSFVAVVGAPATEARAGTTLLRDGVAGLAADADGNSYLVAYDGGIAYPVAGAPFLRFPGRKFVHRVSNTGEVTRVSGALDPAIRRVAAIARDAGGHLYLTGSAADGLATTADASFATGSVAAACIAPFVLKLDPAAQTVLYATYLGVSGTAGQRCGGAGFDGNYDPTGFALVVDHAGNAFVTGQAEPGLRATAGAVDVAPTADVVHIAEGAPFQSASHAFVAKVGPTGAVAWVARLGGNDHDRGTSIALDAGGAVYVAGKTASDPFPRVGGFGSATPYAVRYCLNATPERGFLAKLSADGARLVFSGFLPAMGDTLDRCVAAGDLAPLRVLPDAFGSAVVAGLGSASMREFEPSLNALEPRATGASLLLVVSADGETLRYASTFAGAGVQGIARDPWGNLVTLDRAAVVRTLSPQFAPVELALSAAAICAGQAIVLDARVAASYDTGTVGFFVDGVNVGTAPVMDGSARWSTTLATGVRRLRAVYTGAGAFTGYASIVRYVAVDQPGVCP